MEFDIARCVSVYSCGYPCVKVLIVLCLVVLDCSSIAPMSSMLIPIVVISLFDVCCLLMCGCVARLNIIVSIISSHKCIITAYSPVNLFKYREVT